MSQPRALPLSSLAILFMLILLIPPALVFAENEPNDTPAQANPLSLGVVGDRNASLSTSSDVDWFRVSLAQDRWYVFETFNVSPILETRLALYDTNGTTKLAEDYANNGTGNSLARIAWQAPASGDYYLRVSSYSGAGPYSIRALQKYDEGATWDGYHEPNDTWQTAHLLNVGRENAVTSTIYPRGPYSTNTGDHDWFRFQAVLGRWYVMETFHVAPGLDTVLTLYDVNGTTWLDDDYYGGTGNARSRILWQAPQTAVFYLRVVAQGSSQEGLYSLRVLPKYDEGASWDANGEPDDVWVTASPIVLNQAQGRSLYQRGVYNTNSADQDTFWFAAQAGYEYTIDLSSVAPTLRANLYLLSLDGSTVLASDTRYTEPGTPKSLRYTFATPGRYFVRIGPYSSSYDNYGDYELRVTSVIPHIWPVPDHLELVGDFGSAETQPVQLTISNSGLGSFAWSIALSEPWLKATPVSGSAPPSTSVEVWATPEGLPVGVYSGSLTITAPGIDNSPYEIPITLEVRAVYRIYLPLILKGE